MGLYAPAISYHKGTFYIVTTNTRVKEGKHTTDNFILSTTDIWTNDWSDTVYFDFNGIDPSLFFDDDDRVYVHGSWSTGSRIQPTATLKQAEIDVRTGKLLSEMKEIWPGWAKYDTEGPHMYKRWGYYYLLAAEGGTFEHHMLTISRSTSVWGPFESCPENPIMTADGKDEYIQNIGHGELFQDGTGRWWAAVLGVRKQADGTLGLGRESFLTAVEWPEGGWPIISQPKMTFEREAVVKVESGSGPRLITTSPSAEDIYIRDHDAKHYRYSEDGRTVSLYPSRADLSSQESPTFLGRRQRFLSGTATARLSASNAGHKTANKITAGIALYKDSVRFASVSFDFATRELVHHVWNSAANIDDWSRTGRVDDDVTEVDLRITATPLAYKFETRSFAPGKESAATWHEVGIVEARALDARDFTGPIFGVFASGDVREGEEGAWVTFKDFLLVG